MDPLVFEPYFRPQIWGGRRLGRFLDRRLPAGPCGEAWMLSAHAEHVSRVADGPLRGTPLTELWTARAAELRGRADRAGAFPLLVKYLDCQDLLSIQVHPNDETAARLCPGESGKTEAWVVIEAEPTARIYAGLRPGITPAALERHLDAGTLDECLHSFAPRPGQSLLLPAGTVHAAGGGLLLAEVQQSSDATFRLFDWNRAGPDGRPRALHRREALMAIDWSPGPVVAAEGRPLAGLPAGVRGERLVACPYFAMDRYELAAPLPLPYPGQMAVWMVLAGALLLSGQQTTYARWFRTGETLLVPAAAPALRWTPAEPASPATLLGIIEPVEETDGCAAH